MITKGYGVSELRKMCLEFFQSGGHLIMKSFSLVPRNDNSLLLISSGMAPLKPCFTGQEILPCRRVTACQKYIHTGDISNAGKTARHGTSFEMLGSFSFGDYFKREAIHWSWEFPTRTVGLGPDRLYPSVYEEDDEAFTIWRDEIGIAPEHICRFGKVDNFWEHGSDPRGPYSEIYCDHDEAYGTGPKDVMGGEDDRFMEIWDNVFNQFNNNDHGRYTKLKQKNIDTDVGLERLAVIVRDIKSIFEIDTIHTLLDKAAKLAETQYREDERRDVSLHVITDHVHSCTFMISGGIMPSNEGRGYVLRRLLCRATRHGRLLGIEGTFLGKLTETVIVSSKDGYPELEKKCEMVLEILTEEEAKFNRTADQGLSILAGLEKTLFAEKKTEFSGEDAFKLYDIYGFPFDLTREILAEHGFTVDKASFQRAMQVQREITRKAKKTTNYTGEAQTVYQQVDSTLTAEFTDYNKLTDEGKITVMVRILPNESEEDATALTEALAGGDEGAIVTDKTPFYATMGGQQGDIGMIETGNNRFMVYDTAHLKGGKIGHAGKALSGMFRIGKTVTLTVDAANHENTAKNHSGTHLLHEALREVLGNHVNQAGSFVSADKLRFDFTYFATLTSEEIKQVETLVSREVRATHPVETRVMGIEEAEKEGAEALLGEKYGDGVRVVWVGGSSTELCGGTHVKDVENISTTKIISGADISAGVHYIEALTGDALATYYEAAVQELKALTAQLKTNRTELPQCVQQLQQELRESEKQNEKLRARSVRNVAANTDEEVQDVRGVKLLTTAFAKIEMNELRNLDDSLLKKIEDDVAMLTSANEVQVSLLIMVGKVAEEKGTNAGKFIKAITPLIDGGGGGRPNITQVGGKNPASVQTVLAKAAKALAGELY